MSERAVPAIRKCRKLPIFFSGFISVGNEINSVFGCIYVMTRTLQPYSIFNVVKHQSIKQNGSDNLALERKAPLSRGTSSSSGACTVRQTRSRLNL